MVEIIGARLVTGEAEKGQVQPVASRHDDVQAG
jgi:hypothetical protein